MNSGHLYPVYTVEAQCHDCYKCIRSCPVKAIRMEGGVASVMPERCIACGQCVRVCPSHAKRIRSDVARVRRMLLDREPVYVSLAPSWSGIFTNWTKSGMIAALKRLGFTGVSETALGAQEVSAALAKDIASEVNEWGNRIWFSSACPVVVDYIRRYYPESTGLITEVASPVLTHCKLLQEQYGTGIRIVFIGPCAAKKNESDRNPELLQAAMTFDELRFMLAEENVSPSDFINATDTFIPEEAKEGSIYPLEGGMLETLDRCGIASDVRLETISGLQQLDETLNHLDRTKTERTVFVEALACSGGCVNGPCARALSRLSATAAIRDRSLPFDVANRQPSVRLPMEYKADPIVIQEPDEVAVTQALRTVGKYTNQDELNCGGCGYDGCREFAKALIRGDAEPSQCVSWMRKSATRKANALLRCMPAGVVILDRDLLIVESNEAFVRLFGGDLPELFKECPGLEGADIMTILPCGPLFRLALERGEDVRRDHYPVGDLLLDLNIFTIEPGKTIGVIVRDVTATEMDREQIAQKADEVISRNITIVQEIACKLGEHMADTEILLNSIARGYRSGRSEQL